MACGPQVGDTLRRCYSVARDLEAKGELADAVAVLRSLEVYLDLFPVCPDSSDHHMVHGKLVRVFGRLQEQQKDTEKKL